MSEKKLLSCPMGSTPQSISGRWVAPRRNFRHLAASGQNVSAKLGTTLRLEGEDIRRRSGVVIRHPDCLLTIKLSVDRTMLYSDVGVAFNMVCR